VQRPEGKNLELRKRPFIKHEVPLSKRIKGGTKTYKLVTNK